ncbi:uncharacterized protein PV09_03815 [Verruconis gallopava]|uniref:Mitochondrial resolvase Ydc2 catalytic domain-containing protein n=1 Tax=Verruconis gallopava TaxID=253628 RepID=A0A0D2AE72_9PEZI|nr:uncharacterized protein PV09_03815 [Verruconis gallopava]KIW05288.1 hypothetical protein PV09_03815 [Verruconis gallopava]
MSRFSAFKNAHLRHLLTAVGAKTGGTKPQLLAQLERELNVSRRALCPDVPTRILSVDMGIKNLAFCVCDARMHAQGVHLDVKDWKRIAILEDSRLARDEESDDEVDPFGPSALSNTAYKLVRDVFVPQKPDAVLIERQRFRTGNSSAVQEWTLRVNMFESMIWAVFRAIASPTGQPRPSLWPVNPKQVANFWICGSASDGRTTAGKAKIEKKQKVDLVKKWLSGDSGNRLSLFFSDSAATTKKSFLAARGTKAATRNQLAKADAGPELAGKLDDLADCLLQAAAWCKWEENRSVLASLAHSKDGLSGDEVIGKLLER